MNDSGSIHIILLDFKDTLREEEREVNHHGRVRKFDADGNDCLLYTSDAADE